MFALFVLGSVFPCQAGLLQEDYEPYTIILVNSGAKRRKTTLFGGLMFSLALFFAWASFNFFPLGVLLYPALLERFLRPKSVLRRAFWAALWGVCYAAVFYRWVLTYGAAPWLALALVRGLPWALFPLPGWLLERAWKSSDRESELQRSSRSALGIGLGLGFVSWVLLLGCTGVDWESPAGALSAYPALLSALPALGLVGYAAVLGTLSGLICSGRRPGLLGGGFCLLGVLALLFSLDRFFWTQSPGSALKIALVQTGWAQDEKWDQDQRERAVDRLFELTEEAAAAGAEVVVWPETAWPYFDLRRNPRDSRRVGRLARRLGIHLLATSIEVEPAAEANRSWRNVISPITPGGRFLEHYEKRRLAPFAEYLPVPVTWEEGLRSFALFERISGYGVGEGEPILSLGSTRLGLLICYESMIPGFARRLAPEVDALIVVTNDAPFGHQEAEEAHFRSAILRAAEFRLPVYQAANTGVTGIIDEQGRVLIRTLPGFSGPTLKYEFSPSLSTPNPPCNTF